MAVAPDSKIGLSRVKACGSADGYKESRAPEEMENSGKTAAQAPMHCGMVDLDGQKLEQSTKGEHSPSKDASEGSDASSEPQTATKPSDL